MFLIKNETLIGHFPTMLFGEEHFEAESLRKYTYEFQLYVDQKTITILMRKKKRGYLVIAICAVHLAITAAFKTQIKSIKIPLDRKDGKWKLYLWQQNQNMPRIIRFNIDGHEHGHATLISP